MKRRFLTESVRMRSSSPFLREWRRLLAVVMLGLICASGSGCGSTDDEVPMFQVRGEVFLNGAPAAGAWVHFHPEKGEECSPAYAQVKADGSFELSTFGTNDGAEAGKYVVTLIWRDEERDEGETIYGPDRFDGQYATPTKSTLHVTVKPQDNDLERFDIKS
jgi:hypothetical protein